MTAFVGGHNANRRDYCRGGSDANSPGNTSGNFPTHTKEYINSLLAQ